MQLEMDLKLFLQLQLTAVDDNWIIIFIEKGLIAEGPWRVAKKLIAGNNWENKLSDWIKYDWKWNFQISLLNDFKLNLHVCKLNFNKNFN